jgi:small subunit ribosomal protein S20
MPNSVSAQKDLRQNIARRQRNRVVRSAMRTQVGKVRKAVKDGNFEQAEQELRLATKKLDQASAKKIIHKNSASRTKSRLAHLIKTAKQGQ